MQIAAYGSTARGLDNTSSTGQTSGAAPKDEFLRLLVAQLQHQDPLAPQDSATFVAQLAQFATLEQSAETNQRLGSLESAFSSAERSSYTNLVGKTVTARTDRVKIPAEASTLSAHISAPASDVEVVILDSNGNEVKKMALGARGEGDIDIAWDGTNDAGAKVADGEYRVEVRAKGSSGQDVEAWSQLKGVISALEFVNGSVRFRIGSIDISPAEILSVGATPA
jgi:flagellar basal-body rod modification protein FlgD